MGGYRHVYSGKVRDLYVSDEHPDRVLMVASDRISAYDHVLSPEIPDKGRALTQMTLWWLDQLAELVPNHVLAHTGPDVPAKFDGRALLCQRLDMYPIECVARGYLTGSGLADYRSTGRVGGVDLPPGLVDGSRLPEPIFSPATKAEIGEHDENVDFAYVVRTLGESTAERLRALTLAIYSRAERLAAERGVILADTKFEFGVDASGTVVLADEVLTPDSSRFWPAETWDPGRPQPSFDKQYVRDWLTSEESGWDRGSDDPPPPLPAVVVAQTRERYLEAYNRLTGHPLDLG